MSEGNGFPIKRVKTFLAESTPWGEVQPPPTVDELRAEQATKRPLTNREGALLLSTNYCGFAYPQITTSALFVFLVSGFTSVFPVK